MPKQTGQRLLVQSQLLTTVLKEATWKDGMLRTTLLEPRKLNKSQWEGWVGTGRNGILKIGSLAGLEPATSCV
jgi:hypothetical protein